MVPDILSTQYVVAIINIFYYCSGKVIDLFGWPHDTDKNILDSAPSKFAFDFCSRRGENLKHSLHDLSLCIMSPRTQAGWHPGEGNAGSLLSCPDSYFHLKNITGL